MILRKRINATVLKAEQSKTLEIPLKRKCIRKSAHEHFQVNIFFLKMLWLNKYRRLNYSVVHHFGKKKLF